MAYAVVRTDNLTGITDGSKLASAKYYADASSDVGASQIENGNIVKLVKYLNTEPERETWQAVAPDAGDVVDKCHGKLGLVATPEVVYGYKKYYELDEFVNLADEVSATAITKRANAARVYLLEPGDEFSVTKEAFVANADPGDAVSKKYITLAGNTTKMTALADAPVVGGAGDDKNDPVPYFAECIKKEVVGKYTYFVLKVQ